MDQNFLPLKVKGLIAKKREEGFDGGCDRFHEEIKCLYGNLIGYLDLWMKPLEDFTWK